jgi:hypothetical protein
MTPCSLTNITDRHSLVANVKYPQKGCKHGRQNVLLFGNVRFFLVISITYVLIISFMYCKTRQGYCVTEGDTLKKTRVNFTSQLWLITTFSIAGWLNTEMRCKFASFGKYAGANEARTSLKTRNFTVEMSTRVLIYLLYCSKVGCTE